MMYVFVLQWNCQNLSYSEFSITSIVPQD